MRRLIGVACAALAMVASPVAAQTRWVPAWIFSPSSTDGPVSPPRAPARPDPRGPIGPTTVVDAALTQMFQVAIGGDRVRLRVSNQHGAAPLRLGAVRLSRAAENGRSGEEGAPVLFEGRPEITLPAGASWLSDPVSLAVTPLQKLAVTVTYPGETTLPARVVRQWMTTAADPIPVGLRIGAVAAGLEVETDRPLPVIVAFGDSITEGVGSTPGAGGWPEALNARMIEAGAPWTVLNAGLGGNRVLHQSTGPSALERLDADVLAIAGVRCLIVMEGINDIGRPTVPAFAHEFVDADAIIAGYRQVIERAHARGIKVVGTTLTPFEGAHYYSEGGEVIRQAVNTFIRTAGAFDAVLDFDAALRDPQAQGRVRADLQSGDWLHPSDAGYSTMAKAIPLDICD